MKLERVRDQGDAAPRDDQHHVGGVQLGRVVCVSGAQVVVVLDPAPDGASLPHGLTKGGLVKTTQGDITVYAIVTALSIPVPGRREPADEVRLAELELIGQAAGEQDGRRFRRGISAYPALGDPVLAVGAAELADVYALSAQAAVRIGSNHQDSSHPVRVAPDALLGKHFAVLGTTGCGKSCAVTLILHAILAEHPNAHVVVLDPHNEYRRAFGTAAEVLGPETLQLPYWLLNSDEISSVILGGHETTSQADAVSAILNELIPLAKRSFLRGGAEDLQITVDTPVPYRMSDITQLLDQMLGRLDKPDSLAPYRWLKSRIEVLTADSRFAFMFGGISVQDTMAKILARIFRLPVNQKPISIIDLSGVPSEVLNIVVSVLCRMTFDFAVWSQGAQPILLVCEEAHRYAPASSGLGFEPTKEALARIAKEGRKYGVGLGIVSQRPSELAATILSQCNTIFAFRMTSLRDQEMVRGVTADSAYGLLDFLPSLGDAEAVVIGEGVPLPVRVRFDRLPVDRRPRSGTARFSKTWREPSLDEAFVAQVVDRWRRQKR